MNFTHPQPVFEEALRLFKEQDYERALEHFAWCYDHALELDGSWCGVRGSFLVGYWVKLAEVYPSAEEALLERFRAACRDVRSENKLDALRDAHAIANQTGMEEEYFTMLSELKDEDLEVGRKSLSPCQP